MKYELINASDKKGIKYISRWCYMNIHEEIWINKQIKIYKNALEIAYRKNHKEKIEEYSVELQKLEKLLRN